jgi:regulator of replication initiation timing
MLKGDDINYLKEEIARLTKENEELKQRLNNTNSHNTIHNNSTSINIEEITSKLLSKPDSINIPSYEELAKGYEEMGDINLEIAEL